MSEKKYNEEQLTFVITGHVDHGKSTVIGRMLADTNSFPDGKIEMVRDYCEKNSKTFEYAFLLDALKEEQSQGITIDAARIFFKTKKRNYIVLDAPGHIEFLRNMITGASKAQAALIVIDANEGIQENSTRHGYLVSMLGIKQVGVIINKMDLIDYNQLVYDQVVRDYSAFLAKLGVKALNFIPVQAQEGENVARRSEKMSWYTGPTVIEQIDSFVQEKEAADKPFRFPIQDVYKFTQENDNRRILAGRVTGGRLAVGDEVGFAPSGKSSVVTSIEILGRENIKTMGPGFNCGVMIKDPLYIKPGELMYRKAEPSVPFSARKFKATLFWMSNKPLVKDKNYVAKLGTAKVLLKLVTIINIIDASELSSIKNKDHVDKFDVVEAVFELNKPAGFDSSPAFAETGRFVVIDNYEISGAGNIIEKVEDMDYSINDHLQKRKDQWDFGFISTEERSYQNKHKSKFVLIIGGDADKNRNLARELERKLFYSHFSAYYLGYESIQVGLETDLTNTLEDREEKMRRMGELARILTDAGHIFITSLPSIDSYDLEKLRLLNEPNEILVVRLGDEDDIPGEVDLVIENVDSMEEGIRKIGDLLKEKEIILEYYL